MKGSSFSGFSRLFSILVMLSTRQGIDNKKVGRDAKKGREKNVEKMVRVLN